MTSALPRDVMTVDPCFEDHGVGSDPQSLANDICAVFSATFLGSSAKVVTKLYDAKAAAPSYPKAEKTLNPNATPYNYDVPRETALCLSFYSEHPTPSRRGRIFMPARLLGGAPAVRPSATHISSLAGLPPLLQGIGGPDVDWSVFSRKLNTAFPVTNWFIDDEWDTMRSRGLRATTRTVGTTSEA